MKLGLYISIPFCRTKCTFCNFASGVAAGQTFERYLAQVEREVANAEELARQMGGEFTRAVDSVYMGGGTPSVLAPAQLKHLMATVRSGFDVEPVAEITAECAPSTLSEAMVEALSASGVNRVSLGVQSFVDREARAVGRMHTREMVLEEMTRLRKAGLTEINVDLIAGLPYQTMESWRESLHVAVESGVPHVSVYMLEVDEDSRLGREVIAGGARYHAHQVPDDELTADLYDAACTELNAAGVTQYEISNFARAGHRSRHNMKYWTRQPYFGFGVDAHSLLPARNARSPHAAVRFATPDELEPLLASEGFAPRTRIEIDGRTAMEEAWFLGLRLNDGIDLAAMKAEYGAEAVDGYRTVLAGLASDRLLEVEDGRVRLTPRGRLLSNTVFAEFLRERESDAGVAPGKTRKASLRVL